MTRQAIRALLIEDNPGDARLIELALAEARSASFALEHAGRLSDGLERLANGGLDVLLLDLSLPDSHGIETFERAVAGANGLPIVVLSGLTDMELGERAVTAGAQDYIVKGRLDGETMSRAIVYAIERHELQQKLVQMALIDELTGLHNRRGFMTLGGAALRTAQRANGTLTLLFVDVNGMKGINDGLGHHEGDRALVDVAEIIRATFRESDIMARVGGDEFCVLMWAPVGGEGPIERLRLRVDEFNRSATRPYTISISIGARAYDPQENTPLEELIEDADRSMYREKLGHERRPRLLVVDDDPSLRRLAEVIFEDHYDVTAVGSGADAAAASALSGFDLILLDMRLPDMRGTDIVRTMREDPATSRTPIIVMTGEDDASTELESLRLGADDFVHKPFDPEVLQTRVEKTLARARRR